MRTNSFIFTADVNSAADMQQIEILRNSIKAVNKMAKQTDTMNQYRCEHGYDDWKDVTPKYRVSLMPRGPRRAAAIADGRSPRAYDSCLPLRHAERIDVYVHVAR